MSPRSNNSSVPEITVAELMAYLRNVPPNFKIVLNAPTFNLDRPGEVVTYDETVLTDILVDEGGGEVYLFGEV